MLTIANNIALTSFNLLAESFFNEKTFISETNNSEKKTVITPINT